MEIRVLKEMHELKQVQVIEKEIWQSDEEVVSPIIMRVTVNKGGVVLGAYDGDRMIGILWGFPVRKGKECILWSHVTGVLSAYQGKRVGYALKQYQRLWALENDYDAVHWTFDPMRAQNANFNLCRLGVTVDTYHENIYGEINDALNLGLPSDRFEAAWSLRADRVVHLAHAGTQSNVEARAYPMDAIPYLMEVEEHEIKAHVPQCWDAPYYFVEIPSQFDQYSRAFPVKTRQWQAALRQTMRSAFDNHYHVTDFVRSEGRSWYVLTPK